MADADAEVIGKLLDREEMRERVCRGHGLTPWVIGLSVSFRRFSRESKFCSTTGVHVGTDSRRQIPGSSTQRPLAPPGYGAPTGLSFLTIASSHPPRSRSSPPFS
jgi:hypothetical protein